MIKKPDNWKLAYCGGLFEGFTEANGLSTEGIDAINEVAKWLLDCVEEKEVEETKEMIKDPVIKVVGENGTIMELKRMIYVKGIRYRCPYCGCGSESLFPIEHHEGGSSGYRTFKCTACGKEMEE